MIGDLTSSQGLSTFASPNHRMLQVRVIHCPTVCKALVNHHTAIISDHCMKLSESHADGTPAVLTASIDQAGICCLSLFSTPNDGASPADALPQPSSCSVDLNTIPETNSRVPSALVALTDKKAVAVYGEKLFELDIATCSQSDVAGMALDCTSAMPPGEPPPDASAPHGHPYARMHLGIYCLVSQRHQHSTGVGSPVAWWSQHWMSTVGQLQDAGECMKMVRIMQWPALATMQAPVAALQGCLHVHASRFRTAVCRCQLLCDM